MLIGWKLIFSALEAKEPGPILPRRLGALVFRLGPSEPWEFTHVC